MTFTMVNLHVLGTFLKRGRIEKTGIYNLRGFLLKVNERLGLLGNPMLLNPGYPGERKRSLSLKF